MRFQVSNLGFQGSNLYLKCKVCQMKLKSTVNGRLVISPMGFLNLYSVLFTLIINSHAVGRLARAGPHRRWSSLELVHIVVKRVYTLLVGQHIVIIAGPHRRYRWSTSSLQLVSIVARAIINSWSTTVRSDGSCSKNTTNSVALPAALCTCSCVATTEKLLLIH